MGGLTFETMKVLLTVAFSAFTTEWLCQLPLEVRHIWKSKQWSLLNVLFLLSRYVVMANLIFIMVMFYGTWSYSVCHRVYLVMPFGFALGMASAEGILILRVWALYKRSMRVLAVLLVLLATLIGIQIASALHFEAVVPPESQACVAAGQGLWLSAFWIAPMIVDAILLGMTTFIVLKQARKLGRSPLLELILRDQLLYFLFNFVTCLISSVLMTVGSSLLQSLNNPPAIVVTSICATRIVHSLKSDHRIHHVSDRHIFGSSRTGSSGTSSSMARKPAPTSSSHSTDSSNKFTRGGPGGRHAGGGGAGAGGAGGDLPLRSVRSPASADIDLDLEEGVRVHQQTTSTTSGPDPYLECSDGVSVGMAMMPRLMQDGQRDEHEHKHERDHRDEHEHRHSQSHGHHLHHSHHPYAHTNSYGSSPALSDEHVYAFKDIANTPSSEHSAK